MLLEDTISHTSLRPTQVTVNLDVITSNHQAIKHRANGAQVM